MNKKAISPNALKTFYYTSAYSHQTLLSAATLDIASNNSYLLLYILNGSGTLCRDGSSSKLEPNILFFCPCNIYSQISIQSSTHLEIQILILGGGRIADYYDLYTQDYTDYCVLTNSHQTPYLLNEIIKNCTANLKVDYVELENSKLITMLLTELIIEKQKYKNDLDASTVPAYLIEAKEYINQNYSHKITLSQLAKHTQTNKYQLAHDFKHHFSTSPITYLIQVRLAIAKHLLVNTSQRITIISLDIGFNNTNHFINLFKKETGLTPLQYRKTYGK